MPAAAAKSVEVFRALGRLLCNLLFRKFIDETKQNLVFCSSFSPVLFMYLCHEERTLFGVDADAGMALSALEAFKPTLAVQWRKLLGADSRGLDGLTADMFDPSLEDDLVTCSNVASLVKAGPDPNVSMSPTLAMSIVLAVILSLNPQGLILTLEVIIYIT